MADGEGRTTLVTGATDGVGRVVAKELGGQGWRVLVHGRDRTRGETLVREIEQAGGKASFLAADLSSLAEVRGLAEAVKKTADRLELLINNAGIGTTGNAPGRQVSKDGHELRFAVNYLAGFLLTNLLMPMLKASKPSRIVNVSSAGQQAIDFDDVMLERGYSGVRAYCQSKLAQILFSNDLADELAGAGVTSNALHPATYMPTKIVASPISALEDGVQATLRLVADPALDGVTGRYFDMTRERRADAQAYDAEARRSLRALSERLTGLAPGG
jgi:NAD(P)-dependent dehydrogenase (short-subunit alcohol dehydrogenase family)